MRKRRNMNKRRHRLQMVTLCISTTMVLVLLGLVVLLGLTAHNLQKNLRENVEISVILNDTLSVESGKALGEIIKTKAYAREVTYISSDDALQTAKYRPHRVYRLQSLLTRVDSQAGGAIRQYRLTETDR